MADKKIDYRNRWQKENQERLIIMVGKGQKDKIKAHAAEVGAKSLNAYVVSLIEDDMRATPSGGKDPLISKGP